MNKEYSKYLLLLLGCFFVSFSLANEIHDLHFLTKSKKYFIKEIDINGDKQLDKVVSSNQYEGDELYFFLKKGTGYRLALKSINFSEDGGNVIGEIKAEAGNNEVMSIFTYFPDGGQFSAKHFIAFTAGEWFLTRTTYEVVNWQNAPSKKYVCDIKQDIRLSRLSSDGNGGKHFKPIPKEADRDRLCRVEEVLLIK